MSCVAVLAMVLCGCASRGPALAKYQPVQFSSENSAAQWGMEAWEFAQEGNRPKVIATLENPPSSVSTDVPALIHKFLALNAEVSEARELLVRNNLQIISVEAKFLDEEWAQAITTLSDLYDSGIQNDELKNELQHALMTALNRTIKAAEDAEDAGDYSRANLAWELVRILATALHDGDSWVRASNSMRAASQSVAWASSEENPPTSMTAPSPFRSFSMTSYTPSSYVTVLKTIIARHVENLDWLDLAMAGFDQMALRANPSLWLQPESEPTPEHLKQFLNALDSILYTFESKAIKIECSPRRLCSRASRLIRRTLESIKSEAEKNGLNFQELGRAFVDGALLLTDIRTRMIWADEVPALKRQLGEDYVGIGAQVTKSPNELPVLQTLPGSPARQAGVQDGDRLLAVNGISTQGQSLDESVEKVLGRKGTTVELTLERGEEPDVVTIHVQRKVIQRPSILGWKQTGITPSGKPRWDWLINRSLGIAYIKIESFTSDTERDFRVAMDQAKRTLGPTRQVEGLIIDLRRNTGGTKDAATRLLDLFLETGSVCVTELSNGKVRRERANWRTTRLKGMPLVLLMDDSSASASELLAGTLQGAGDAVVIGEQSFGKGSAQSLLQYQGGIIVVTTAWFGVPTEGSSTRFIDRSREPGDWGILPELQVTTALTQDQDIQRERGQWFSFQGKDAPQHSSDSNMPLGFQSVLESNDRALILSLALLQARVFPAKQQSQLAETSAQ